MIFVKGFEKTKYLQTVYCMSNFLLLNAFLLYLIWEARPEVDGEIQLWYGGVHAHHQHHTQQAQQQVY
jgi:hypothetical protein